MANLLGQNIGTNYKGILSLDSTINTPLDATLRAVTDGEGNASPLQLSTDAVSLGGATGANWDNTNKRLGIGTDAPSCSLQVSIPITGTIFTLNNLTNPDQIFKIAKPFPTLNQFDIGTTVTNIKIFDQYFRIAVGAATTNFSITNNGNIGIGIENSPALARLHIKGSGTTSSTTALLVQNSAGTELFKILDSGASNFGGSVSTLGNLISGANVQSVSTGYFKIDNRILISSSASGILKLANINDNDFNRLQFGGSTNAYPSLKRASNNFEVKNADDTFGAGLSVGAALNASAILQADSTTLGFLPPRMTTTQKNAISTPASGLIVYDSTTNKLSCYNGTTWNDLF